MKRVAIVVLAVLMLSGVAVAQETATLNVSLVATSACSVDAATIDFGTVVAGGGTEQVTSYIDVNCSSGTPYTVALDAGQWFDPAYGPGGGRQMNDSTTGNTIYYHLFNYPSATLWGDGGVTNPWDARNEVGTGGIQSLQIVATTSVDTAGSYSDIVNISVSY